MRSQSRPPDETRQEPVLHQVLGVDWDVKNDQLLFDVSDVAQLMKDTEPKKRNAISLATRLYDPLGVISPVTVRFKQLFQKLCEKQVDWDEHLTEELLTEWESLTSDLQQFGPLKIPRCYPQTMDGQSYSLRGFCDASQKAYAAVHLHTSRRRGYCLQPCPLLKDAGSTSQEDDHTQIRAPIGVATG